jgi:hypothetical protein
MDYHEFRNQYEAQHPASVPVLRYELAAFPAWVRWAVMAMFMAAAVISGVHTVPTVYQTIESGKVAPLVHDIAALSSFIAVELAILLSAYLLKRNRGLGWLLLITTSFVAGIANLQSSLTAMSGKQADAWTQIVAVSVGLAAPLIVLASGKLLVDIFNGERTVNARADERYHEECKKFDAEVLAAFEKFSRSKKASVQLPAVPAGVQPSMLPASAMLSAADMRTHGHGHGYARATDARERVRTYLREHPDAIRLSSRELAEQLGVGKTIVAEELKTLRQGNTGLIQEAEAIISEVNDGE